MLQAVLLSALLSGSAHGLETTGLPNDLIVSIAVLEQGFQKQLQGRKLLAESSQVPRRAGRTRRGAVEYRREAAALVYDAGKISTARDWEFELAFARAASLAGQGLPVALVESEERARADELVFALEKARTDKAFAGKWRDAVKAGLAPRRPRDELAALGYIAARLSESVDAFIRAVESEAALEPDVVRFTALADFVERYGPDYREVSYQEDSPFARVGQKRYSAALYRAALAIGASGGLASVREALGPLETRTLPDLRDRLRKFR